MNRYGILAALPLAVACVPTEPVPSAQPFSPPDYYAEWWHGAEACSGLSGDFARIEWLHAPSADISAAAGEPDRYGGWSPPHSIYVADEALAEGISERHWYVVTHEAVHDLTGALHHEHPAFAVCGVP